MQEFQEILIGLWNLFLMIPTKDYKSDPKGNNWGNEKCLWTLWSEKASCIGGKIQSTNNTRSFRTAQESIIAA